MRRWLDALVARFWVWCESVYDEPDDEPEENSKKREPRIALVADSAPDRRTGVMRGKRSHGCDGECTRTDPVHEYATPATRASFHWGNRCMNCGVRDDRRRAHNETRCVRPHLPELA